MARTYDEVCVHYAWNRWIEGRGEVALHLASGRHFIDTWRRMRRALLLASLGFFALRTTRVEAQATGTTPAAAHPQATGFSVIRFEPSERGSDWFSTESLDLRGKFR